MKKKNLWRERKLKLFLLYHHNKPVYLFVNGGDLFDIYITTSHGTIKEKICDIYLDELVDVIDKKIEWIDIYED
jgi:hypothetical protein